MVVLLWLGLLLLLELSLLLLLCCARGDLQGEALALGW